MLSSCQLRYLEDGFGVVGEEMQCEKGRYFCVVRGVCVYVTMVYNIVQRISFGRP